MTVLIPGGETQAYTQWLLLSTTCTLHITSHTHNVDYHGNADTYSDNDSHLLSHTFFWGYVCKKAISSAWIHDMNKTQGWEAMPCLLSHKATIRDVSTFITKLGCKVSTFIEKLGCNWTRMTQFYQYAPYASSLHCFLWYVKILISAQNYEANKFHCYGQWEQDLVWRPIRETDWFHLTV